MSDIIAPEIEESKSIHVKVKVFLNQRMEIYSFLDANF